MTTEQQPEAPAKPDGVKIGGLMRCCLETLDEHYPDGPGGDRGRGAAMQALLLIDDFQRRILGVEP